MPAKSKTSKAKASKVEATFDGRAPRQGPLGEIERKTEADLIAVAAAAAKA